MLLQLPDRAVQPVARRKTATFDGSDRALKRVQENLRSIGNRAARGLNVRRDIKRYLFSDAGRYHAATAYNKKPGRRGRKLTEDEILDLIPLLNPNRSNSGLDDLDGRPIKATRFTAPHLKLEPKTNPDGSIKGCRPVVSAPRGHAVIQKMIAQVLEAVAPQRDYQYTNTTKAVAHIRNLIREGYSWVGQTDVRNAFGSIPAAVAHELLAPYLPPQIIESYALARGIPPATGWLFAETKKAREARAAIVAQIRKNLRPCGLQEWRNQHDPSATDSDHATTFEAPNGAYQLISLPAVAQSLTDGLYGIAPMAIEMLLTGEQFDPTGPHVLDEHDEYELIQAWSAAGLPQGSPVSPVVFNWIMAQLLDQVLPMTQDVEVVQYADNLIVLGRTRSAVARFFTELGAAVACREFRYLRFDAPTIRRADARNVVLGYEIQRTRFGFVIVRPDQRRLDRARREFHEELSEARTRAALDKLKRKFAHGIAAGYPLWSAAGLWRRSLLSIIKTCRRDIVQPVTPISGE